MIIEKLKEYIRKERARGVAPEKIREALLKQGEHRTKLQIDPYWDAVEVDEAFRQEGVQILAQSNTSNSYTPGVYGNVDQPVMQGHAVQVNRSWRFIRVVNDYSVILVAIGVAMSAFAVEWEVGAMTISQFFERVLVSPGIPFFIFKIVILPVSMFFVWFEDNKLLILQNNSVPILDIPLATIIFLRNSLCVLGAWPDLTISIPVLLFLANVGLPSLVLYIILIILRVCGFGLIRAG